MLIAGTATAGEYSAGQAKAHCSQKWGTQYDMVKYCIDKQREGWAEYSGLKKVAGDLDAFTPSLAHCEQKWAGQWDMINYCAKKQVEGMRKYVDTLNALPPAQKAEILNHCGSKWQPQYDMMAYCATKQAAAWRAINQ
jgi:hypothetical protein